MSAQFLLHPPPFPQIFAKLKVKAKEGGGARTTEALSTYDQINLKLSTTFFPRLY